MRALVVDDNTINRVVACEMLRALGADVQVAGSGEDVRACLQRSKPFDLILMGVEMPEMDGYEATRRVCAMGEAGRQCHEWGSGKVPGFRHGRRHLDARRSCCPAGLRAPLGDA